MDERLRQSANRKLAKLDRASALVDLIRGGCSIRDAAAQIGIAYSTARSDFFAWCGYRQEELSAMAREIREDLLTTMALDQQKLRRLAMGTLRGLEQLEEAAQKGEAPWAALAECDVTTAKALLQEHRELAKLILGMVDSTSEAAQAHQSRNLRGSGVSTVAELRERIAQSPALARHFVEGGILAELEVAAREMDGEVIEAK